MDHGSATVLDWLDTAVQRQTNTLRVRDTCRSQRTVHYAIIRTYQPHTRTQTFSSSDVLGVLLTSLTEQCYLLIGSGCNITSQC